MMLCLPIEKGYFIYQYGGFFQLSSGAQYKLNRHINFSANLKYEWRGKDTRENNEIVGSSGSHLVLFTPQAMYHFKHNWSLMVLADLPVYKYVHGEQLTNSFAVQLSLFKRLVFQKTKA